MLGRRAYNFFARHAINALYMFHRHVEEEIIRLEDPRCGGVSLESLPGLADSLVPCRQVIYALTNTFLYFLREKQKKKTRVAWFI